MKCSLPEGRTCKSAICKLGGCFNDALAERANSAPAATTYRAPATMEEWGRRYDDAVQWRDWQTCDYLLEEREKAPWFMGNDTGGTKTPPDPSQAATEQIAPLPAASVSGTDKGYMEVLGELQDLHVRKSATYGTEGERFHNFVALGEAAGKPPEYGAWMRIVEKGIRALNMIDAGLEDDVKEGPDVAGLAIIAEALRRRRL